jgi:hypothetical protein
MRKIISIIILLFILFTLKSQEANEFARLDSLSYQYYVQGNWSKLAQLDKLVRKGKMDYYYMNYRMGVAQYYMKNLRSAIGYIEKAINQNEAALQDTFLIKKLYDSYVWTLKYSKADQIRIHHPDSSMHTTKRAKPIQSIYVEGGVAQVDDIKSFVLSDKGFAAYKESDMLQGMQFYNIDIQGYISSKIKYQVAYTHLNMAREKYLKDFQDTIFDTYNIRQDYIYGNLLILFNRFYIQPAINFSIVKENPLIFYGYDPIQFQNVISRTSLNLNNTILGLRFGYHWPKLELSYIGSYSNFNETHQIQSGVEFLLYPAGNLNRYSISQLIGKWEDNISYFIFRQKFGMKMSEKIWVEYDFKIGNLFNANIDNAYYVFNISDKLRTINDLKIIYLLNPKLELNFILQHNLKENTLRYYPTIFQSNLEFRNFNFQQINIIGGIKWKL